jgi:putative spermidine/putrescine transport system ATP-binding protein
LIAQLNVERPEKIQLEPVDGPVPDEAVSAVGTVHDVVYLGSDTKYHVELDAGGRLEVVKQNVATTSGEALALKGRRVRLVWERRHVLTLNDTNDTQDHSREAA